MSLQYQKDEPVELEILDKQKALNTLNKKSIQAGYYPSLTAFANQSWQAQRNEFNFFDSEQPWFPQTVIGLSLQVPIFDGFSKHYRVQQSKIDIQKLELDQENTKRSLDMQFENAR
ncbi:MAG: TolC family protein [Owenweeksia sp.]|nr:TolC family protein [Owenweeksia sp.]